MPDKLEHLKSARRNYDISKLLLDNKHKCTEWVVITLFYSAVHFLEAYLASLPTPLHPGNHSERNTLVAHYFSQNCYRKYALLKDMSVGARYYCKDFKQGYIDSSILPAFEFFKKQINYRLGTQKL